jgi:hypothetical protein
VLAEVAGLDQGEDQKRKLFIQAIKYDGKNMPVWLAQVRHQIEERSDGKLTAINRLKSAKKK